MNRVECRSAEEVYAAVAAGDIAVVTVHDLRLVFTGDPMAVLEGEALKSAHVEAWGSAHVVARESAHVVAWGSAHVVARESAHVEAWGSAHVVAWGSAHVEARGSAHVEAWGSAHVEASKFVTIHQYSELATIHGGVVIYIENPKTAVDWCEYYGVPIANGVAVLFKAVNNAYLSPHGMSYEPGSIPAAPDWDGGAAECGGGLHFSAHPLMAKEFAAEATRFIACPVLVSEIAVHPRAEYPNKVKAPRCAAPVWEVDAYGARIENG